MDRKTKPKPPVLRTFCLSINAFFAFFCVPFASFAVNPFLTVETKTPRNERGVDRNQEAPVPGQAALRRRELLTQLQVPQVQRIEVQSLHTVKSTDPKWRRHCSQ